jgi:hypothetical protein
MAAAEVVLDFVSHYSDQDLCDSEVNCCGNCLRLKDYLKVVLLELKCAQQIIKILHDEKANSNNLKNQANIQNLIPKVLVDKHRLKWRSTKVSHTSEKIGKVKHKTRVLGDSHTRGLANEQNYKLTHEFETQGMTKPGSTLVNLVNTSGSDPKALTKNDACIVWGGTNDVRQNETIIGIRALKHFISSHKHTNVIVLSVPQRHDLAPNSCVNHEVLVFNRMLDKLKKVFQNLSVVTVDSDRDLYARHGLHLNAQGKEHAANRVTAVIKNLFSVKRTLPIALKWK